MFIKIHIWITESIQITPNIHRQISHIKSARRYYFLVWPTYMGLGIHCWFQWDNGHRLLLLNLWLIAGWGRRLLDLSQQWGWKVRLLQATDHHWTQVGLRQQVSMFPFIICLLLMNYLMEFYFIGFVNAHLPGCFCPWTFRLNIGLNTSPSDSFVSYLNSHLGYSAGEFQALQLIVLAVFGAVD